MTIGITYGASRANEFLHVSSSRHGSDRAAGEKLGRGDGLPYIGAPPAHIGRPAHDASDQREGIPADVCDCRLAPGKGGIGIRANQRDFFRHGDSPAGEKLQRGDKLGGLVHNERRGWRDAEQRGEQFMKAFDGLVPIREVESARRKVIGRKLINESALNRSRLRKPPELRHNSAMRRSSAAAAGRPER